MTPHLVKWQEQFSDRDFTVVSVDNGRMDSVADLESHIRENRLVFPVLHDEGGTVCGRFGVSSYPYSVLVDRDGIVVWAGHPEAESATDAIRAAVES